MDNGTVVQNGLIKELNFILLNMLSEQNNFNSENFNNSYLVTNENLIEEKIKEIQQLQKLINYQEKLLYNYQKENEQLKNKAQIENLKKNQNSIDNQILKYELNDNKTQNIANNDSINTLNIENNQTYNNNNINNEYILDNNRTELKNKNFDISKDSVYYLINRTDSFKIEFNCNKDGIANLKLYFIPLNIYNPFNKVIIYN